MNLTKDQIEFACKMFAKWTDICFENGRQPNSPNIDHSALLRRLLDGGQPHKNPPPTRNSYPGWSLIEDEEIEISTFYESNDGQNRLIIDQNRQYEWVDKEEKTLRYIPLNIIYRYSERETTPRWVRRGLNPEDHKYLGKFLTRLNDPETGKEEKWPKTN